LETTPSASVYVAQICGTIALAPERKEFVAKGHTVADEYPANENCGEGVEGHEGRVDGPFLLDDAVVEDDKSGMLWRPTRVEKTMLCFRPPKQSRKTKQ
jgi:hypothetical protein